MKIVTVQQMRAIEARSENMGVSTDTLMEKAGLAVAQRVRHHVGPLVGVPIVVLVGPGNNGGDGLVTARHLHAWGARVGVYLCGQRRTPDPNLETVHEMGVPVVSTWHAGGLSRLSEAVSHAHLILDAVLGTGRTRPIDGAIKDVLEVVRGVSTAFPGLAGPLRPAPGGGAVGAGW